MSGFDMGKHYVGSEKWGGYRVHRWQMFFAEEHAPYDACCDVAAGDYRTIQSLLNRMPWIGREQVMLLDLDRVVKLEALRDEDGIMFSLEIDTSHGPGDRLMDRFVNDTERRRVRLGLEVTA